MQRYVQLPQTTSSRNGHNKIAGSQENTRSPARSYGHVLGTVWNGLHVKGTEDEHTIRELDFE